MVRSLLLICVSLASAAFLSAQTPVKVTCPATIGQAKKPFDRISIYNGKQGGQEYELAPDDDKKVRGKVTQSWSLKDYRSMNIFLRCRYQGTEAVLAQDIPTNVQTCTFTFEIDRKGTITGGRNFACR